MYVLTLLTKSFLPTHRFPLHCASSGTLQHPCCQASVHRISDQTQVTARGLMFSKFDLKMYFYVCDDVWICVMCMCVCVYAKLLHESGHTSAMAMNAVRRQSRVSVLILFEAGSLVHCSISQDR